MTTPSIQVVCPQCASEHRVNIRLAGRRIRCPRCDAAVTVPALSTPADEPAAESSFPRGDASEEVGEASVAVNGTARVSGNSPPPLREVADPEATPPPGDGEREQDLVVFASDPVFDAPGQHHAGSMPELPPALQPDEDDELPPRAKRKEEELDMTPMVDVTFLLLIFFMVTASFSLQKSIEMPRQQTDAPSTNVQEVEEEDQDMVTVQIDEFGSFLVLAADWERETPGKQNLTSALREAIGDRGGAVRLVIEVHEDAMLRHLVDCMDAGTISGYGEIQVTQVDGFE